MNWGFNLPTPGNSNPAYRLNAPVNAKHADYINIGYEIVNRQSLVVVQYA